MGPTESVDLDTSLGYLLKETAFELRAAMEAALRPLGMTVTRYSCLELLRQRPGLSNSDLARGAFVTRQAMNVLLQALEREGLVTRPGEARQGRVQPVSLTDSGRRALGAASAAVRSVEASMHAQLDARQQADLRDLLRACVESLRRQPR